MKETETCSLPDSIRLRLEQTLAQWGNWRCDTPLEYRPQAIKTLGGGVSNFTVLVGADRKFVVRLDGIDPATTGLHRQVEWRVLQTASNAGVAPTPRYFNPELGSLVCDYLPADKDQSCSIHGTARLLRDIHGLPPVHHRLDLGERILRLEKILARRGISPPPIVAQLRAGVHELLADLRTTDKSSLLCHNDLLAANRLRSNGLLWALDWEYCAMGSPWYDLAVIICGDGLPEHDATTLVETYLGREPYSKEAALIEQYSRLYRYLELLWYMALDKQPGEDFLVLRASALSQAWDIT